MENEPLTLQLFIGTADDRLLRPHAFYQVHRITGKTVSTTSHEAMVSNTKVLEIPLLPENNMRAIVDCAGILKLRNSDIELRKGETDIGRKNTRVRLVFRVHIPQPNGRTLSLQRSAQELPLVEKQSAASCPVLGGKKMVLSGHNFLQDSKVIFVEKAPGISFINRPSGITPWEVSVLSQNSCSGRGTPTWTRGFPTARGILQAPEMQRHVLPWSAGHPGVVCGCVDCWVGRCRPPRAEQGPGVLPVRGPQSGL
uniref:RHD domain-containing protein n=1 Tax=Suricata suricatta TaxID=37032 RepID=A0A673V0G1_SURSU